MSNKKNNFWDCVKIASLNVDGLVTKEVKQQKICNWMLDNDMDVLCIQEWNKNYADYEKVFAKTEFERYFDVYNSNIQTAIIFNNKYRVTHHKSLKKLAKDRLLWRTWITIYGTNGALNICSVYWSPSDINKMDAMQILDDDIREIGKINSEYNNYFCINGDFNAKSELWDDKCESADERGEYLEEWFYNQEYFIHNNGYPTHFNRATKQESAIDLTITCSNLSALIKHWYVDQNSRNLDYNLSDHYYLVIWIDFKAIEIDEKPYVMFDYKIGEYEEYGEILKQLLVDWYEYFYENWRNKSKLNEITEYLQDIIKYSAIRVFGIKKIKKRDKFWLGKRARMAIEQRKALKKEFRKCQNNKNKSKRIKTKINKCTDIINKCKLDAIENYRTQMEKTIDKMCIKDSKYFWHLAKRATNDNKSSICPLKDKNGKIIAATPEKQAKILHKHFNREIGENEKSYNQEHRKWHKKISETVTKEWIEKETNEGKKRCKELNEPITKQQILRAIEKSKLDTACGHDSISMRMIHIGRFVLAPALELLFNLIFLVWGIFPMCWLLINIFPIPKPGRDNSMVKNNRPISLIVILARIFCKVMVIKLLFYLMVSLPQTQADAGLKIWNCGFQRNKSTEDILIHLTENIDYSFENGTVTELAFMDIQSAYDTVWHNGLIYKLKEYFLIEGNFLIWIANYLVIGYNRVILDGYFTEWMKVGIGVKQGCPLSPLLWSIYINDFKANLKMAAFADDITIFNVYNCMSLEYSYQLQEEIDRFFDWTLFWRLKISTAKCNSLTLTRKRNFKARVYAINNEVLDCVHHPNNAPFVCMHNIDCKEYYSIQLQDNISCMIDTIEEFNDNDIVSEIFDDILGEFVDYENESNGTNFDYNNSNINEPSHWQMNVSDNHSIPLCVRILGLFFDPKLNWVEQIKTVIGRCKGKIYKLAKIAYHKDFNLSPYAVYKLFLSTIRPSIEYAFSVYSGTNHFQLCLQRLQNTAIRLSLRQRSCAPDLFLSETLNAVSLQQRLELAQVKLWSHYIRAPNQLIKSQIIREWEEATQIHNNNNNIECYSLKSRKIYNYGMNKFKFIQHSPISRIYFLLNELNEIRIGNKLKPLELFNFKKDIFKAAPMYSIEYPTNLTLYCDVVAYYEGKEMAKISGPLVIYKEAVNEKYIQSNVQLRERKELDLKMRKQKQMYGNVSISEEGGHEFIIIPRKGVLDLFTDGSCKPNPGPGGCAVHCPQFKQFDVEYVITHFTTINYAEQCGIEQAVLIVEENKDFLQSQNIWEVTIFTDSSFALNNMRYNNVNEIKYYYDKIEETFVKMNNLKEFKFNIVKIKAHHNILENETVDKMAKKAADNAKEMEANEENSPWKNEDTPAIVLISMFNELITVKYNKIKNEKWKRYKKKLEIRKDETDIFEDDVYVNEQLFIKAMFRIDDSKVLNKNGKYLFEEIRYLNALQAEIIMKLRTESAHLNYFLAKQYKLPDTNGTCLMCGTNETVTHYLIDCQKYQKQRDALKFRLLLKDKKHWPIEHFKHTKNWTAIDLLFPHFWQVRPKPDSMAKFLYERKIKTLLNERLRILRAVVLFVRETKRFDSDIGI